ncbi:MAG: hypothetical protein P8K68_07385 [Algibacter sp.]|uniref:DUF6768 family protein n=1 Tax=Algibacter sp. TaxID=1872428 RepID=UPI00261AC3D7|nr:DUF6768 family protein [Algibacter sp.]MDG1729384.1 hypothetical protein [Algibacter sp.]MDG2178596.1 hypothetical protein [Algibacter sp.]
MKRIKTKITFKNATIMKNNMENIDKLIKETLTEQASKFYDDLEEQNMIQMLFGLFEGKNKWFMYVMNLVTLIFFGLFIYCLVQFLKVEATKDLLKWELGSVVFLLGVSMLKVFAWMQMDKNALFREMKRLEIQISSLSGRMSK